METIPLGWLYGILVLLLIISGFFSGSETGLMRLNRYRLRRLADEKHGGAMRAHKLLSTPDRLIGLILLGNNFVNIIITQLASYIGFRLYGDVGIAIATGVLTIVLLIFAEVAPKTLAAIYSERIAFPAAYIYTPLLKIAYPVVWLVNSISNGLLRLIGMPVDGSPSDALNRQELRAIVDESGTQISPQHQKMLLGILDLQEVTVEDIMVPRNEMTGVDLEDDWDAIAEQFIHAQHARLPVYRESMDRIVGIVHLRRILPLIISRKFTREALESVIRTPYYIPAGTSLTKQLLSFQDMKRRVAFVVDEYGDIDGLITMEDILEEIVGEFTSDPAASARDIHPQGKGCYLIDGSIHIRKLNRILNIELDTQGPKTLNGLILEHMEMIPEPNTSLLLSGYPVEIIQIKSNAVKVVKMQINQKQTSPADALNG
ncbi:MAG: HlyC/CorC family transporter [Gammaproteobacteria bacterium]|nr:HlyC/CorC family transporter [Gammaproteobacteria bacterium]